MNDLSNGMYARVRSPRTHETYRLVRNLRQGRLQRTLHRCMVMVRLALEAVERGAVVLEA